MRHFVYRVFLFFFFFSPIGVRVVNNAQVQKNRKKFPHIVGEKPKKKFLKLIFNVCRKVLLEPLDWIYLRTNKKSWGTYFIFLAASSVDQI
jgi:hypothetical protein